MFRLTTMKLSLLSAFATLFLLVSMLASSGTASAHTASASTAASCQPPFCTPGLQQPHIAVYGDRWIGGGCKWMAVVGSGFAPGSVALDAYPDWLGGGRLTFGDGLNYADADANKYGNFLVGITICGFGLFGSPYHMATLYAYNFSGWYVVGPYSNTVLV